MVGPEDSIVIQLNVYAQRDWCSPSAPYYELRSSLSTLINGDLHNFLYIFYYDNITIKFKK
jgi:hypothetical protein